MSHKYKFQNPEGLYFVTCTAINWIDIFTREEYSQIIIESLDYCRKQLGMQIFAWCLMPSHLHLVIRVQGYKPELIMGRFKEFTSKKIQLAVKHNPHESRKDWLVLMFEKAALESSNVKNGKFWQAGNHPIELWSPDVISQKVEYIHMNPVEAGLVFEAQCWKYSSAIDYSGGRGVLDIDYL